MKLYIIAVKPKPFTGTDGKQIPYFWYTARTPEDVRITFGSKTADHKVGETLDLNVEKFVNSRGEESFKEFYE